MCLSPEVLLVVHGRQFQPRSALPRKWLWRENDFIDICSEACRRVLLCKSQLPPVVRRRKTSRSPDFPNIRPKDVSHLDRLQVLGALETELGGDSQPYRCTLLGREGLPIEVKR